MARYIGTITEAEVGVGAFHSPLGRAAKTALGRILPQDVGKEVYEVARLVYQVENDEQRDARLGARR